MKSPPKVACRTQLEHAIEQWVVLSLNADRDRKIMHRRLVDGAPVSDSMVSYDSGTEFAQMIRGKRSDDVFKRLDRAFEELRYLNPKLYNAMLNELV